MRKKNKVLITGGCGFIGSRLVRACVSGNIDVVVVDNLSTGKEENKVGMAEYYYEDVRSPHIKEIAKGCSTIFHLAALTSIQRSIEEPKETFLSNVEGTVNVLEAARENKTPRVIFASSSSVYGYQSLPASEGSSLYPVSPYGVQKACGEMICEQYSNHYDMNIVCLRYFNVYGPGQRSDSEYAAVVPRFLEAKKNSVPATIYGTGEQTRSFTYINDVISATLLSTKYIPDTSNFEIYNVAGKQEVSVIELHKVIGSDIQPNFEDERPGEVKSNRPSTIKASFNLGWSPQYSIEDGIKEMMDEQAPDS